MTGLPSHLRSAPPRPTDFSRVAIVVPCYQSARYLADTVASVRAQTLTDWTLVVVDDGSTDDPAGAIADAVAADPRISLVRQDNRGVAAARNTGARVAGPSAYLHFLDADDILEPTMLERLVDWLECHSDVGMAFCRPRFIDANGYPTTISWMPRLRPKRRLGVELIPDDEPTTPFASVFCLAGIVPSLSVMRRQLFEKIGGWDESFGQHYEDTLLFLQIALHSEIHYVPAPLVRHRRHAGQSTADVSKFATQEAKLYARFRDPSNLPDDQAVLVRAAWRFRERRLLPRRAFNAALESLRTGRPITAARFLGGAGRILAGSALLGPGRVRL